ncbi:M24 family peptidase-like protein [Spirochaeta thermophila DSM 6578]|uniref:M24 family peptidase-like protein n=1 Tax=Winmispira thermophila (strain ATCC 700085 / DSM 6578 / Z-1203) TaxID=869211 RepID=G0GA72_WINT7|nr:M24 family metallopeptidase [Spirochaeta thermophila]AEJ60908.1 M24 family peptidase-like protein [Spirochaeta thermophila DSM 6578]
MTTWHPDEIAEKLRRVRALMEEKGLEAVYLKRQTNFSWITGGGRNVVGITLELGVAGILVTSTRCYAVCNNIESPRMREEERLEEKGFEVHDFLWYEDREGEIVRKLSGGGRLGADHPFPGAEDLSAEVKRLRYALTPWEVERYREVGYLTSLAIEETAREVRPGDKECAVVGRLAHKLWAHGLDYVTIFVAADERISAYRHPISTEKEVKQRAMLCVNARKYGLVVSLTRFVNFGPIPEDWYRQYLDNVRIDCTFMAATRPGVPVVEAFKRGIEAYKALGYPDEYKLHHQGGAIGYEGRDYKVTFTTQEVVQTNQAFTWNPSITGTKSEDTMVATTEGPQLLSKPILFPSISLEVDGIRFERPGVLEMPG